MHVTKVSPPLIEVMKVKLQKLCWLYYNYFLHMILCGYFPDGIDVYFDNVGGEMLEAAVANMNIGGRIAGCGVIAKSMDDGKRAMPDMLDIVYKRIMIRGFLAADFMNLYPDFLYATVDHLRKGTIQTLEDISSGVESIPLAFVGLFHGANKREEDCKTGRY